MTFPIVYRKVKDIIEVITDGPIDEGYSTTHFSTNGTIQYFKVLEILEQRPASGNWTGKTWQQHKPVWNRVRVSYVESAYTDYDPLQCK